jgi:hypothetical protein
MTLVQPKTSEVTPRIEIAPEILEDLTDQGVDLIRAFYADDEEVDEVEYEVIMNESNLGT